MHIIQVCRRFGPVGGMERYVWELTQELAMLGHHIDVLCAENLSHENAENIQIHVLGKVYEKPRWLAHLRFSRCITQWLNQNLSDDMLVHSHERTAFHHLTTFHGPPFAMVHKQPWWKKISLRVYMNLYLEKRELCAPSVQCIVPNSQYIAEQLSYFYPQCQQYISEPMMPGVRVLKKRMPRKTNNDAGVIGFIGKEWKRKGLMFAIDVVDKLAETRPNLIFRVGGALPQEVERLFKNVSFRYELLGMVTAESFYPELDVLLHPASKEPYGMVVTEALASKVPVVISDVCGAVIDVNIQSGSVLNLEQSVEQWAEEVSSWLVQGGADIEFHRSWKDVAQKHVRLYQEILDLDFK